MPAVNVELAAARATPAIRECYIRLPRCERSASHWGLRRFGIRRRAFQMTAVSAIPGSTENEEEGSTRMNILSALTVASHRRTGVAIAAAAVALAGTPAHAQVRPASCTVVNIGQPGKITVHGVYAGEVEQQYDSCHHVRAHFQWSAAFRSADSGAEVFLDADASPGADYGDESAFAYQAPDAYSDWTYIYTNGANTWDAEAYIEAAACVTGYATGDWHNYTTGAEFGSTAPASC